MVTEQVLRENLSDLEKEYVDYIIKHFAEWQVWANASQRVADGEHVDEEEIPEAFHTELKITRVIVEMLDLGKFDWNDPKLRAIFNELKQAPFYTFFGQMITRIALRIARLCSVNTLLEIGAGSANLTSIMARHMAESSSVLSLIATDSSSVILENIKALQDDYPQIHLETALWDIMEPPSEDLLNKVTPPVLLYERYTLNYAKVKAFENIAKVADIVVLGDWFNYTGELFAYDEVFKKIGAHPLFYKDVKPALEQHFSNQYIFDKRALDTIKLPNISVLIAWK